MSGRYWDWAAMIAEMRSRPGSWAVRMPNTSTRIARVVKERGHPLLRLDDGLVEVLVLNEYRTGLGGKRGDVYLRFTPNATLEERGNTASEHTP